MNDQRLEIMIGHLLRAGVTLAAAVVFAGGVFYLVRSHAQKVSYQVFVAGEASLRSYSGIIHSAGRLNSDGLIEIGLLLLIATPVARVAIALVGFALERDRLYTVVSLIVLAILALSLMRAT
jgi:uncharacterized membrane protein